jgi:hypothetical protein
VAGSAIRAHELLAFDGGIRHGGWLGKGTRRKQNQTGMDPQEIHIE